jgi:hypothetical protein
MCVLLPSFLPRYLSPTDQFQRDVIDLGLGSLIEYQFDLHQIAKSMVLPSPTKRSRRILLLPEELLCGS